MSSPADDPVARVRATFDAIADDYDQSGTEFFAPAAEGLVDALAPRPGERGLDIGCGRGAVTTRLARAVLPGGAVDALDVSPAMVEHTRALVEAERLPVRVEVMDAVDPDLPPASYDLVASSLVLFFLPDPAASLARWVGLLVPGGRIGLVTFGRRHPAWTELDDLFTPWLPPGMLDPKTVDPDGPFTSDSGMEALLRGAGASDVRTVTRRVPVHWGDVGDWRRFSMSTGQRSMWARVPTEEHGDLLARVAEVLDGTRDDHGRAGLWQDMRYTLGTVPG